MTLYYAVTWKSLWKLTKTTVSSDFSKSIKSGRTPKSEPELIFHVLNWRAPLIDGFQMETARDEHVVEIPSTTARAPTIMGRSSEIKSCMCCSFSRSCIATSIAWSAHTPSGLQPTVVEAVGDTNTFFFYRGDLGPHSLQAVIGVGHVVRDVVNSAADTANMISEMTYLVVQCVYLLDSSPGQAGRHQLTAMGPLRDVRGVAG